MGHSNGGSRLDQRLLEIGEVAEILHHSEYTVMQYCRDGVLPAVKVGRRWLIPEDRLADWIEAGGRNTKAG